MRGYHFGGYIRCGYSLGKFRQRQQVFLDAGGEKKRPALGGPLTSDFERWRHARSMYLPVRVSILIFSPVLMNSGACTVIPVSTVMTFCTLLAESPRIPSGASVTVSTTLDGSSMDTALSSTKVMVTGEFSTR